MLEESDELYVAKGKKVVHLKLKDQPDLEAIVPLMLGPTGNLRAPTLRKGRTLIIGFDESTYKAVLDSH
jgi:arsenate reductase-like glutaredoxin family protein